MDRREFLLVAVAAGAGIGVGKAMGVKVRRPNIVVIVTDDQGYADLSAYSHHAGDISTPNMDRIADGGVLFTQGYVSAPVCSPSRAGWNTGRYQQRWDANASWNPGVPVGVKTLAEYLKGAGYATGKVGKSDYGKGYHSMKTREYPLNHGFDEFLGFSSHAHDFFLLSEDIEKRTPDPHGGSAALGTLFHNRGKKSFADGYTTDIFTGAAIDFVKRHKDEEFFLTVSYNSVHHLIHEVPKKYLDKFGVEQIDDYVPETMGKYKTYYNKYNQTGVISDADMRKYYLANLCCLDDNIGRLLDSMEELGVDENTLLFFFADNGGSPLTGANNRPLRGSKYRVFEGGIRVPFIVKWPGKLGKGKRYEHCVSTLDILPSCLEAAEVVVDAGAMFDGQSFLGAVKKNVPSVTSKKPMFWQFQKYWAVRDGDWKLVNCDDYVSRKPTSQILQGKLAEGRPMLFNLKDEPSEQRDVYEQNPEVVKRLQGLYDKWHGSWKKVKKKM